MKKKVNKKTLKNKIIKKSKNIPVKSKDVPGTQGMLYRVRDELKHENVAVRSDLKVMEKRMSARFEQVDARFEQVDARFEQVDARFEQVDARFEQIDARFDRVDERFEKIESKLEEVLASVQRVGLIVEEQNARNKYVLDGYAQLYDQINKQSPKDI